MSEIASDILIKENEKSYNEIFCQRYQSNDVTKCSYIKKSLSHFENHS